MTFAKAICPIVTVLVTLWLAAPDAEAAAGRYALLFGANRGNADETPLKYAVSDATRLRDVLTSHGAFLSENVVVLDEPSADRVRAALARLNARIRSEQQDRQGSLLVVFYSGHADALSLHLDGTSLPWEELRNLTVGSAAAARLLIVDACRSGHATRVKGTRLDRPFAIPEGAGTPEGFAILSSATAGESAQESDAVGGSFFTHHLIAALHGVADSNRDGQVMLSEAYQYTSNRTVASTAATMAGIQHPTYLYDLKGRADLVLTQPGQAGRTAGLQFSSPGVYLLWRDGQEGALALEASIGQTSRTVWMRPGRYFLQRRVPQRFYEGFANLALGKTVDTDALVLRSVDYAQLVRKGSQAKTRAYALSAWGGIGHGLVRGYPPQSHVSLIGALVLATGTLDAEVFLSRSTLTAAALPSQIDGVSVSAGARKVFDVGIISFSAGLRIGGSYFAQQSKESRNSPGDRRFAPHLDSVARIDVNLPRSLFAGLEARVRASYIGGKESFAGSSDDSPAQGLLSAGIGAQW
jgi:hypothetical protein